MTRNQLPVKASYVDFCNVHDVHFFQLYCRLEFLKAVGGKLVSPNVLPSHDWTGDRVRQIAAQGAVYLRTTYPLNLDGLNDVS